MNTISLTHRLGTGLRLLFAAALVAGLMLAPTPVPVAHAAEFTVNTTADTTDADLGDGLCADSAGDCSLRAAIQQSNALPEFPPEVISLPAETYVLTEGRLEVRSSFFLNGDSRNTTFIDGNSSSQVMVVYGDNNPTVNIADVTIQNGRGGPSLPGGGVFVDAGAYVSLTRSTVQNNRTNAPGGGLANTGILELVETTVRDNHVPISGMGDTGGTQHSAGGVFNSAGATLRVMRSAIVDNSATRGGGIRNAGGHMEISNSTISGNDALTRGGGIMNFGTAWVAFSTITNNETDGVSDHPALPSGGGGIYNDPGVGSDGFTGAQVDIANSILAGNRDRRGTFHEEYSPDCYSEVMFRFTSFRGNVVGVLNGNCIFRDTIWGDTRFDQVGSVANPLDAGLGTLTYLNSLTPYHPLLPGSPANDRGTGVTSATFFDCSETDQRGIPRPQGRDCDVGAFEVETFPLERVLDDFTRPDGSTRLGPSWSGSDGGLRGYRVVNPDVDVGDGGPIYWKLEVFGVDQEAFIRLVNVDPGGLHQSLLLKVQDNRHGLGNWRRGAIAVFYNAIEGKVGIETFVPRQGWTTWATFDATLQDGDQLGGRALTDGTIQAFVNGVLIGETNAGDFFVDKGGRIGLWFIDTAEAVLDDFGGGDVP